MVRLVLLLLGVDYLRKHWHGLLAVGVIWVAAGVVIFLDALDGVLYFPLSFFACLLLLEGLATLVSARSGVGGQRTLRYVKGVAVILTSLLVLARHPNGNFVLSMVFGTLFLVDGMLQAVAAHVVRYPHWRLAMAEAVLEILIAIFFYQPYPTHYAGTVPYFVGLFLLFGGLHMAVLALRVKALPANPALPGSVPQRARSAAEPPQACTQAPQREAGQQALTVHIWTPIGSSKAPTQRQPIVDRYIAAVDVNGVISTGHAALESPEGIYISLYPGVEIDRSPDELRKTLRATAENDIPGRFLSDYASEAREWCPSTVRVQIRNYDPAKLRRHWDECRRDATYNLTHRNCSSTVAHALEASIDGVLGRAYGSGAGWSTFLRVLVTPELWVAAQVRKRATTMAWTPGLTLDYARAVSLITSPRPFPWWKVARAAMARIIATRRKWRRQDGKARPTDPKT